MTILTCQQGTTENTFAVIKEASYVRCQTLKFKGLTALVFLILILYTFSKRKPTYLSYKVMLSSERQLLFTAIVTNYIIHIHEYDLMKDD